MITNKNYNVDLAGLSDKTIMYDFAKEMYSDVKTTGIKSTKHRSFIKLLKSPSIMVFASGVSSTHKKKTFSNTLCLSSDPNELCDRVKIILQEKRAR